MESGYVLIPLKEYEDLKRRAESSDAAQLERMAVVTHDLRRRLKETQDELKEERLIGAPYRMVVRCFKFMFT